MAEAEAVARRLAPLRLAATAKGADTPLAAEMGLAELLGVGDPDNFTRRAGLGAAAQPGPAAGADRGRRATAAPIELDLKESAQDGMGPHGLLIGATGSGKSELLRTLVLGAGRDALVRDAQLRPGRLQGRRDVRLAGPAAAHRRGDHQPGRRAAAGRPDGGRDQRRADPPAGAAAPGRQLRQPARLREGPGGGAALAAAAVAAGHLRRVLRAALRQARLHRPVRPDRTARPVARRAPAAGLASGWRRGGCAGWTRTCRTGSGCGRSPRWSRGRCSACRTRTSCPARPATAT